MFCPSDSGGRIATSFYHHLEYVSFVVPMGRNTVDRGTHYVLYGDQTLLQHLSVEYGE